MQKLSLKLPKRKLSFVTVNGHNLIRSCPEQGEDTYEIFGDFSFYWFLSNLYLPYTGSYYNNYLHKIGDVLPVDIKNIKQSLLHPTTNSHSGSSTYNMTYYLDLIGNETDEDLLDLSEVLNTNVYCGDDPVSILMLYKTTIPHRFKLRGQGITILVSTPFHSVRKDASFINTYKSPKDEAYVTIMHTDTSKLFTLERKMTINDIISLLVENNIKPGPFTIDFMQSQHYVNEIDYLERQFELDSTINNANNKEKLSIAFTSIELTPSCGRVVVEFPINTHTISDNTVYNRMLNCMDKYKVTSFSQKDTQQKTDSVLSRLNELYLDCLPHIKTHLDSIGLTQKVLSDSNGIAQDYPFYDDTATRQESYINHSQLNGLARKYSVSTIEHSSRANKGEPKNYLLNNEFGVFQKLLVSLELPPITPKSKDPKYASFVKNILTLQMYSYYIYKYTSPQYHVGYYLGDSKNFCYPSRELRSNFIFSLEKIKVHSYFIRIPSALVPTLAAMVPDATKAEYLFEHIVDVPNTNTAKKAQQEAPKPAIDDLTKKDLGEKIRDIASSNNLEANAVEKFIQDLKSALGKQ